MRIASRCSPRRRWYAACVVDRVAECPRVPRVERLLRSKSLLQGARLLEPSQRAPQIVAVGEALGFGTVGDRQVDPPLDFARVVPDVGRGQLHGASGRCIRGRALSQLILGLAQTLVHAGEKAPLVPAGAAAGRQRFQECAPHRPARLRPPSPRLVSGRASPSRSATARALPRPAPPTPDRGRGSRASGTPSHSSRARRRRHRRWRCATRPGYRPDAGTPRPARAAGRGRPPPRATASPGTLRPSSPAPGAP